MAKKKIKAQEFDSKFDRGEDISSHLDLETATKSVLVDFPLWMIKALDVEAKRLGVPRQSIIKMWIGQRLDVAKLKGA